ncbi:MAG TPA: hypothetical protein VLV15_15265, partial [Dongiaceae bacterium]|nr:hypothetical protein [Dongiaceae bacterium]
TLATTAHPGGAYYGFLYLERDGISPPFLILPLKMVILPAPALLAGNRLDFDTLLVGATKTASLRLGNGGGPPLEIRSATIESGPFVVSGPLFPLSLSAGTDGFVSVDFHPTQECVPCTSTLHLETNDPYAPDFAVALTGVARGPAIVAVARDTLRVALANGLGPARARRERLLSVGNLGQTPLTYAIDAIDGGPALQAGGVTEASARPAVSRAGGPDRFGYRYEDSSEPDGPTYNWVELGGVVPALPVTGSGASGQAIAIGVPIGFDFPFYGQTFNTVNIHERGWLSFTNATVASVTNQFLPDRANGSPENLLAVMWNPFTIGGTLYAQSKDGRFVAELAKLSRTGTTLLANCEVILYPDGRILYQYRTLNGTQNVTTIGIQNAARDDGLTVTYNAPYLVQRSAIQFSLWGPTWIEASPREGTVFAGDSATVLAAFDATGLVDGRYRAV